MPYQLSTIADFPAAAGATSPPRSAQPRSLPQVSLEQVNAFVELSQVGSICRCANALHISEEGLRSRLQTLEHRVGVRLYQAERGRNARVTLTQEGKIFLAKATQLLENAYQLTHFVDPGQHVDCLQIAASQYLTYPLIDIVRAFHEAYPECNVRMSTRTEEQILADLQTDTSIALGICAPLEYPSSVHCIPWFSTSWYFVARQGHPLLRQNRITLEQIAQEPLIIFETGSTGRQHVLEAFYEAGIAPSIKSEATSTHVIARMVERGLGVSILPLLPPGAEEHDLVIGRVSMSDQVRPIQNCILLRKQGQELPLARAFHSFVLANKPASESAQP